MEKGRILISLSIRHPPPSIPITAYFNGSYLQERWGQSEMRFLHGTESIIFFLVSLLLLVRLSQEPNDDFTHRIIGFTARHGSQFNELEPV